MILVNFKTYKESTGEKALNLLENMNLVFEETNISMIACPQAVDLQSCVENKKNVDIWAQHVDYYDQGRATGFLVCEVLKHIGVNGVLLNHSEHKLSYEVLEKTVLNCKKFDLKTLIFADSKDEAMKVVSLKPDFIGYEPPELVGSEETSVAKEKPEIILDVSQSIEIPLLVGAGVKSDEDVRVSVQNGAVGIGVASGVVKADSPKEVLANLAKGFLL